jgi:hypothetical protein
LTNSKQNLAEHKKLILNDKGCLGAVCGPELRSQRGDSEA